MPSTVGLGLFEFEGFILDLARGSLRVGDQFIALRPKSFDVLRYLVENAGRLVSKDELANTIWADIFVEDDALTHCVSEVRKALGDHDRRIIKTVPRRGYLFVPRVCRRTIGSASDVEPATTSSGALPEAITANP